MSGISSIPTPSDSNCLTLEHSFVGGYVCGDRGTCRDTTTNTDPTHAKTTWSDRYVYRRKETTCSRRHQKEQIAILSSEVSACSRSGMACDSDAERFSCETCSQCGFRNTQYQCL
eukprot:scaffold3640_cov201-Alexandrium_tamarense.AAC.6